MQKICLMLLVFVIVFAGVTTNASATQNIGIIIIGDDDFKQEVYFNRSAKIFDVKKNPNISVKVGESVQKNYSDYCKEKSISDIEPPKLENLLEFANQNNFDRVLCLVVKTPEVSEYQREEYGGRFLKSMTVNYIEVSLSTNAYFCDDTKLLKTFSTTRKKELAKGRSRDPKAKATRSAFTLCIEDIEKAINNV